MFVLLIMVMVVVVAYGLLSVLLFATMATTSLHPSHSLRPGTLPKGGTDACQYSGHSTFTAKREYQMIQKKGVCDSRAMKTFSSGARTNCNAFCAKRAMYSSTALPVISS